MNATKGRSTADILCGTIFAGTGAAFAFVGQGYGFSEGREVGAGAFPAVVGVATALLGLCLILRGFLSGDGGAVGRIPWRQIALIVAALVAFTVVIYTLEWGLAPASFVAAFIAGLAGLSPPFTARALARVALVALGITVLCAVIFWYALDLTIPLFG